MSTQFPPSSPIVGSFEQEFENPFYEPDTKATPISTVGLKLFKEAKEVDKQSTQKSYPTPHPSSTLGRSSSPVREQLGDSTILSSDYELERHLETELKSSCMVNIELDPRDTSRLAIGRKKSVCDIRLPRGKNISRQHAFISYIPQSNQIRLECNGTNGLVVAFPKKLTHVLVKKVESINVYELVPVDELAGEKQVSDDQKALVKTSFLTSFVLLKGETVIMPYLKNTIIDFRQCEACLSLLDVKSDDEDAENETETEDEELTPMNICSDDFAFTNSSAYGANISELSSEIQLKNIQRSPETPQCKHPSLSPIRSASLKEELRFQIIAKDLNTVSSENACSSELPTTPKKSKMPSVDAVSTPVTHILEKEDRRRKIYTPSPKKSIKKRTKKQSQGDALDQKELLQGLKDKGVDLMELQNVLVNHLAFSNVQQVPVSQLQDVNSTISTLSRPELRALLDIERCIGVIYRTGKDAAGRQLDEEYYYDVENDANSDRRQLVSSLKGGRSGLRACRKVHKQYFWKKPSK